MPRKLVKLKVTEIASVDRGAGEGVRVLLSKRKDSEMPWTAADAPRHTSKADTPKKRHQWAVVANAALADGKSEGAAVRIANAAVAKGLTMPNDTFLGKARNAFMNSISSILGVSDDPAKVEELIGKSADQLMEHIAGVAGDTKKADDPGGEVEKGETMTPEILKALGLADNTSAADVVKAIETLKAAKPKEDGGDNGGDDKTKKEPVEKAVVLPESITKALAEAEMLKGEVAALKRAAELETFTKRAIAIGLPASEGETLLKAYAGGGNEAVDKILGFLKAANAQAIEAGIFKEFGSSADGSGDTSALGELNQKAAELRKADPKLSADAAFAKVYTDPANAKLAARERAENRPTIVASR